MSLNNTGEKCAICSAYLFADDDVVYCPQCGAPHHRDCYNAMGHCGLSEFHGTDKQYKKPDISKKEEPALQEQADAVVCKMCGEKYAKDEPYCPNCKAPNFTRTNGRVISFDFLGGVPADFDLGDGVTADEAKKFVLTNTHRYIPKFAGFKVGKKASWNWMAFLTPSGWLASRKMYLHSIAAAALQIAFTMLLMPFNKALNYLDFSAVKNYVEYSSIITQNIDKIGMAAITIAFIGVLLDFVLRIIVAVFGDLFYKKHVISKVKEIKEDLDTDKNEGYRKKGGVNIFAGALVYFAVSELPAIIASLIGII